MSLLQAVEINGSISAAARSLGMSYRHVWGELKRWEHELGNELIIWEKGQSARLSTFGAKLMWAERQAQARLAPQIEALSADLERAFAVAFDPEASVLTLYASHDDALPTLRALAAREHNLHLDVRFTGSVDAIAALNAGRCIMAGFHTRPQPAVGSLAQKTYQPLLQPGLHKIIGFGRRTQGLIVAPGNPLALHSLADVVRTGARFVNRPAGTGTRVLLEELLAEAGLRLDQLAVPALVEPSHAAVAQAIAAGAADVGLGIEGAARSRGMGFVAQVQEDYHLVCLKSALEQPAVKQLCQVLQSSPWREQMATMPGYQIAHCGEVQALTLLLPWWKFSHQKRH